MPSDSAARRGPPRREAALCSANAMPPCTQHSKEVLTRQAAHADLGPWTGKHVVHAASAAYTCARTIGSTCLMVSGCHAERHMQQFCSQTQCARTRRHHCGFGLRLKGAGLIYAISCAWQVPFMLVDEQQLASASSSIVDRLKCIHSEHFLRECAGCPCFACKRKMSLAHVALLYIRSVVDSSNACNIPAPLVL